MPRQYTIRVSGGNNIIVEPPPPPPPPGTRRTATAGSVLPGNTAYTVPVGAKFASPSGDDTTGTGTQASPYRTCEKAIGACASGGTVVLRAGSYHEGGVPGIDDLGVIIGSDTRSTITVQSYPNEAVWFEGSEVFTGWTADTTAVPGITVWRRAWTSPAAGAALSFDRSVQFSRGSVDGTTAGYVWLNANDPDGRIANYPEQGWVTNNATGVETRLRQVPTLAELGPGEFFVAGSYTSGTQVFNGTTVYIGTNPSGNTVRFGTLTGTFMVLGIGCTLRGVGIRRYVANLADGGPIRFRRSGGTAENVYVTDCGGVGFDTYLNTRVGPTTLNKVTARYCGLNGGHAHTSDDLTVTDSLFEYNNINKYMQAPAAGGFKITASIRSTFKGCVFRNNYADGLWFDQSCFQMKVGICDSQNNSGHGFEAEISETVWFADLLSTGNGKDGILVRCTDGGRVWCCTTSGNGEVNLDVTQDNRRVNTGVFGADPRHAYNDPIYGSTPIDWIVRTVDFMNCVSANPNPAGSGGQLRIRSQESPPKSYTTLGPTVNGNVYGRPNASSPSIGWALASSTSGAVGYTTFAAYKSATVAAGVSLDATSGSNDGVNPLNADFTVKSGMSTGTQVALPSDIAAFIGQPTTAHLGAFL